MLINLFRNGFDSESLIYVLFLIPTFLITITVHEYSHAYVAYKMGDPTARSLGRLTLNPLKHIDPIGLVMILVMGFGWAKPVPINTRYFKNARKGMALSAAAGPISNIIMAIIGGIIFGLISFFYYTFAKEAIIFIDMLQMFFYQFMTLNVYFAVFNLVPVPPLDGSRIVSYVLPAKLSYYYNFVERYGFLILIVLLYTGILRIPLEFLSGLIITGISYLLNLLPFLII